MRSDGPFSVQTQSFSPFSFSSFSHSYVSFSCSFGEFTKLVFSTVSSSVSHSQNTLRWPFFYVLSADRPLGARVHLRQSSAHNTQRWLLRERLWRRTESKDLLRHQHTERTQRHLPGWQTVCSLLTQLFTDTVFWHSLIMTYILLHPLLYSSLRSSILNY